MTAAKDIAYEVRRMLPDPDDGPWSKLSAEQTVRLVAWQHLRQERLAVRQMRGQSAPLGHTSAKEDAQTARDVAYILMSDEYHDITYDDGSS